jgi:CheY-like chemotaxis protein
LSGLEAARLIRQSGQTGQVPIVFISGHAGAPLSHRLAKRGATSTS